VLPPNVGSLRGTLDTAGKCKGWNRYTAAMPPPMTRSLVLLYIYFQPLLLSINKPHSPYALEDSEGDYYLGSSEAGQEM
jgi:hypothetical protein